MADVIVTQRERYPVRRLNQQTRQQTYPAIDLVLQPFEVAAFDYQRVLNFLQTRCWHRKVSKIDVLSFYYQRWFLSCTVANQWVSVRLNPTLNEWVIFTSTGAWIKSFPNIVITEKALLDLPLNQSTDSESG